MAERDLARLEARRQQHDDFASDAVSSEAPRRTTKDVIAAAVRGHRTDTMWEMRVDDDADEDPMAAVPRGRGRVAGPAQQGDGEAYAQPAALLNKAHEYFTELNAKEKRVMSEAHRRIQEMKKINANGGDSQGFKFKLPKNVKTYAKKLRSDLVGGDVGATLQHSFGGDEVALADGDEDVDGKPMKRKKRRGATRDDFYQHQVWQKWTQNAEKFLSRGRASAKFFEAKGVRPPASAMAGKHKMPKRSSKSL